MSAEAARIAGKGEGRRRLILLAAPLLLAAIGTWLWSGGALPPLPGLDAATGAAGERSEAQAHRQPSFLDMPDVVANLNVTGRRPSYVKLRSKLELSRAEDAVAVQAVMPRLLDLFSTYLREMRPEELRGSAGTHRLREELLARANIALAAPGRGDAPRVTDVLFVEILIQ